MTTCRCLHRLRLALLILTGVAASVSSAQTNPTYLTMRLAKGSNEIHAVIMQVSETNRVTLHLENATVAEAVREVSRQFHASESKPAHASTTNVDDLISINLEDVPLEDVVRMFTRMGGPPLTIDEEVRKEIHRYLSLIHI